MDVPTTLTEFRDSTKELIESQSESLAPDDDWDTQMLMRLPSNQLAVVLFDPRFHSNDDSLAMMVSAMVAVIKEHRPTSVAFTTCVWSLEMQYAVEGMSNEENPHSQEAVIVLTVDHEGAGTSEAVIERHEGEHPTLKPWRDGSRGEGFLIGPLQEALRTVANSHG